MDPMSQLTDPTIHQPTILVSTSVAESAKTELVANESSLSLLHPVTRIAQKYRIPSTVLYL